MIAANVDPGMVGTRSKTNSMAVAIFPASVGINCANSATASVLSAPSLPLMDFVAASIGF